MIYANSDIFVSRLGCLNDKKWLCVSEWKTDANDNSGLRKRVALRKEIVPLVTGQSSHLISVSSTPGSPWDYQPSGRVREVIKAYQDSGAPLARAQGGK